MKFLLTGSVVAGAFLFSTDVQAREFDMFVCQDCSFNEARQFAIQRATPQIHCQPAPGQGAIGVDDQQCFSDAKDYLVVDNTTKTLYAFTLTHSNQGTQPWDMTLNVSTFTPTADLESLAINAVNFKEFVDDTLDEIASDMSRTFAHPSEIDNMSFSTSNYGAGSFSTSSSSLCEEDPGYRAAMMAFGEDFTDQVHWTMNDMWNRAVENGIEEAFFGGLEVRRYTGVGVSVGGHGLGLSGNWEYVKVPRQVIFDLTWNVPGNDFNGELNQVVFDLSLQEDSLGISTTMNRDLSAVGGVALSRMHPDRATLNSPVVFNPCIVEALSQLMSSLSTNSGGGVIGGSGWNDDAPPGGGGMPIPGGGTSWNTSRPDLCREHHYRNGERVATFLVPCP